MAKYIDKAVVAAEIKRRINGLKDCHADTVAGYAGEISGLKRILAFIDTLEVEEVEEEPVSNDLEEAADKHLVEKGYLLTTKNGEHLAEVEAKGLFKAGAKWQKEQMVNGVDLEKELIIWHRLHFKKGGTFEKYGGFYLANSSQLDLAKHFFELGRNADELPQKPEQG